MRKIIFFISFLASLIVYPQDGSLDLSFNPTGIVGANVSGLLVQPDGKILFSDVYDDFWLPFNNTIGRLNSDGSLDTGFVYGLDNTRKRILAALQSDGKILLIEYDGTPVNKIYRLYPDGSLDESFKTLSGANNHIVSLVVQPDDKIIISGYFTEYNGTNVNHMVRLNTDGSLDTSRNLGVLFLNGSYITNIESIHLLPDGKILSQMAVYSPDWQTTFYNTVRLNSDLTLDNTFELFYDDCFHYKFLIQSTGKIVKMDTCVDWGFGEPPYEMFFRLNNNGLYDHSFHRGGFDNGMIHQIGLQSDDKIIIAGNLASYDGVARNHLLRLNSDGTLDTTFNAGSGPNSTFFNAVTSIVTQSDGKILISGNFTEYNGIARNHIARINSTSSLSANEFETKSIAFYPNPVKDILNFNFSEETLTKEYEIYDLQGKRVIGDKLNSNSINVSNLSKGVYMLKINTSDGHFSNKFLKE